jgi:tetratricopeptide (TPR) repeat protein
LYAQQEQPKNQPKWETDWKRGLEEAKERKVPILIVIPSRQGSQGPIIYPKVLDDAQVVQACENFVCFIADDKRFPEIEKRIAAEYHKGKYGFYGQQLQIIFCRPDGEELEKYHLVGDINRGQVTTAMTEVLKLYPDAVPKSKFDKCRKLRDLAELFRTELAFGFAIKKYKELAEQKVKLEMVELAADKEKELLEEASKKIEEAEKLLGSQDEVDRREAFKRLVRLKVGTEGFKEQQEKVIELIGKAKQDASIKSTVDEAGNYERAFREFLKAEEEFLDGDLQKAYGIYKRITKNFGRTEFAERAEKRAKEIEDIIIRAQQGKK